MHASRHGLLAVAVCLLVSTVLSAREWTDTAGRKVQGEFVGVSDDGNVEIETTTGKILSIPLYRFSQADQEYIERMKNPGAAADASSDSPGVDNPFDSSGVTEVPNPFETPDDALGPGSSTRATPSATSTSPFDTTPSNSDDGELDPRDLTRARDWTITGGRTIRARYIRIHNGMVILSQSGRIVQNDFYTLGPGDQKFLREHLEARGESSKIPERPAPTTPSVSDPRAGGGPPQIAGGGSSTPPYTPPGSSDPSGSPTRAGRATEPYRPPAYSPPSSTAGSSYPSGSSTASSTPTYTPPTYSPPASTTPDYGRNTPSSSMPSASDSFASNSGSGGPSTPSFDSRPSTPSIPSPPAFDVPNPVTGPRTGFQEDEYYQCSNCLKEVSESAKSCPYCFVSFDYVEDSRGNRKKIDQSGRIPPRLIIWGGIIVLSILGGIFKRAMFG